jgi:hypothetical protein
MSTDNQPECERLCRAVIQEKDPEKLTELVKALNEFLQRGEERARNGNLQRSVTASSTHGLASGCKESTTKEEPSAREETELDACVYCRKPITPEQHPCKGMPDGRHAHLVCYLDHEAEEEKHLRD